jgi:hypothetical protein
MGDVSHFWLDLPIGVDFAKRDQWQPLADNLYAANRATVLVVRRQPTTADGLRPRHGPPERQYTVRANDAYTIQLMNERVVQQQQSVETVISRSVTAKVCKEWTEKISAALSGQGAIASASVSTELQATTTLELTEEIGQSVKDSVSYTIEEKDSVQRTIAIKAEATDRTIVLRRLFWPIYWDVYLHSVDFLQLRYQRGWVGNRIRKTVAHTSSGRLMWPLFRVTTYYPQAGGLDVSPDVVADELHSPNTPRVGELKVVPRSEPVPPQKSALIELASQAFPMTIAEYWRSYTKKKAAKRPAAKKAAKRPAAKKAAKRPAAKKAAKRPAAKKAAKRPAAKKAAKRPA